MALSTMKRGIVSKLGFKKMSDGHPWLMATDIIDRTILPPRAGAFLLGDHWWLHSPESFLRLRRLGPPLKGWMHTSRFNTLTNADQFLTFFGDWALSHFKETLLRKISALGLTADAKDEDLCLRWIFSENDFIPGLIVDLFGDTIVAQINSAPIEVFWIHIPKLLLKAFHDVTGREGHLLARRNGSIRRKEGLEIIEPEEGDSQPTTLRWNGLKWHMQPGGSQKTGAYFDQRENHTYTAALAQKFKAKTAWDICSHEGGFSLHLLKAGLTVTAVDQSAKALAVSQENIELNGLLK